MEVYGNNYLDVGILDKFPIIIYVEVKGKRKTTIVKQLPFTDDEIKTQLKLFKNILGCNGTYKNNYMLFLGDHKNYIENYYRRLGHEVKTI